MVSVLIRIRPYRLLPVRPERLSHQVDGTDQLPELGVALGTATFQAYYEGVLVGRKYTASQDFRGILLTFVLTALSASNLTLQPQSTTSTHFTGRIVPQSGSDLDVMGQLFSNYLAGQNQTLSVTGESVDPGSGTINWLSTAFKTLTINVTLPGQTYEVS